MTKPIPLSSLPPVNRRTFKNRPVRIPDEWRLVCECENQDDGEHGPIRAVTYTGPTKHNVLQQARDAGWSLSYRWKTSICPKCTGLGE